MGTKLITYAMHAIGPPLLLFFFLRHSIYSVLRFCCCCRPLFVSTIKCLAGDFQKPYATTARQYFAFATFFSDQTLHNIFRFGRTQAGLKCGARKNYYMLTSHLKRSSWMVSDRREWKKSTKSLIWNMNERNKNQPKRSFWDSCATIWVRLGHKSMIWTSYSSITQVICCQSTITYSHIRCKHRAIQFYMNVFFSRIRRSEQKKKSSRWMHDVSHVSVSMRFANVKRKKNTSNRLQYEFRCFRMQLRLYACTSVGLSNW